MQTRKPKNIDRETEIEKERKINIYSLFYNHYFIDIVLIFLMT